eukprot:1202773-Amphidinium_carterae.1
MNQTMPNENRSTLKEQTKPQWRFHMWGAKDLYKILYLFSSLPMVCFSMGFPQGPPKISISPILEQTLCNQTLVQLLPLGATRVFPFRSA